MNLKPRLIKWRKMQRGYFKNITLKFEVMFF